MPYNRRQEQWNNVSDRPVEGSCAPGLRSATGYRRSVLVLFRNEDEIDIAVSTNSAKWALEQLKLDQNRDDTEKIVNALLRFIASYNAQNREVSRTVMDVAISWKRADWWNQAVPWCESFLSTANTEFTAALAAFGLGAVETGHVTFPLPSIATES